MGKECVRLTPQITRVPVPVEGAPVPPPERSPQMHREVRLRLHWRLRMGICALLLLSALGLRLWDEGGAYRAAALAALDEGWTTQELSARLTELCPWLNTVFAAEEVPETSAAPVETASSAVITSAVSSAVETTIETTAETTAESAVSTPAWPEEATKEAVAVLFPWTRPVPGIVTSAFGYRDHPVDGAYRFHYGVDLRAAEGDPVQAFAGGVVTAVGYGKINGNTVKIAHSDGIESLYAHLSFIAVEEGDTVTMGQTIGKAGATGTVTGPHLHFQLYKDGLLFDPMTVLNG